MCVASHWCHTNLPLSEQTIWPLINPSNDVNYTTQRFSIQSETTGCVKPDIDTTRSHFWNNAKWLQFSRLIFWLNIFSAHKFHQHIILEHTYGVQFKYFPQSYQQIAIGLLILQESILKFCKSDAKASCSDSKTFNNTRLKSNRFIW